MSARCVVRGAAALFVLQYAVTTAGQPGVAAAGAAGAAAGAAAGGATQPSASPELLGSDLSDWTDPRTRTSSRLFQQCGHVVEVRLTSSNGKNHLNLLIANQGEEPSIIRMREVSADFESGRKRNLATPATMDEELDPSWSIAYRLPFPDRGDFRDQHRLTVRLPVDLPLGRCLVEAVLDRPSVPTDARTYTDYLAFEVFLEGGARFFATDGQKTLGAADAGIIGVGLAAFPWVQHGFSFDILLEPYGNDGIPAVEDVLELPEDPSFGGAAFLLGYTFRPLNRRWGSLAVNVSAGPYFIDLTGKDQSDTREEAFFAVRERLRFVLNVWHFDDGGVFTLAPALQHIYVLPGDFGPVDASGHGLGALLGIGVGG